MPEVGVYIFLSSFAAEKGKNKRKPCRDPGGLRCSCPACPPARLSSAKAEGAEMGRTSRTRRNEEGTRGAEELIFTSNPITGLVTPSHLLSLLGVTHRKSARRDGSTAISRWVGNLALLTQTHASHAMLWGFFLGWIESLRWKDKETGRM